MSFIQEGAWLLEDQDITWGGDPYYGGYGYSYYGYGYGDSGEIKVLIGDSPVAACVLNCGDGYYYEGYQKIYLCSEEPFDIRYTMNGWGYWETIHSTQTTIYNGGDGSTRTYYYIDISAIHSGYNEYKINNISVPNDWFIYPSDATVSYIVQQMVDALGGPYDRGGQGIVNIQVQAPGQMLTFTSALLGTVVQQYIDDDAVINIGRT